MSKGSRIFELRGRWPYFQHISEGFKQVFRLRWVNNLLDLNQNGVTWKSESSHLKFKSSLELQFYKSSSAFPSMSIVDVVKSHKWCILCTWGPTGNQNWRDRSYFYSSKWVQCKVSRINIRTATVKNSLSDHTVCARINTPVSPSSGYEHIKAGPMLHKHRRVEV